MRTRDKVGIFVIITCSALIAKTFNDYDSEVIECVSDKAKELNTIYDSYQELTNPVIKNRIDKKVNIKVQEIEKIKNASHSEQRKLCGLS
ncbi:hypothetical protein VCRA2117O328_10222 [Vibrio crassostreae]|nr:hypothetical protein VCRA2117O328_10222 [Vibrio crassostreae]